LWLIFLGHWFSSGAYPKAYLFLSLNMHSAQSQNKSALKRNLCMSGCGFHFSSFWKDMSSFFPACLAMETGCPVFSSNWSGVWIHLVQLLREDVKPSTATCPLMEHTGQGLSATSISHTTHLALMFSMENVISNF
jgi:hypothetical protein